MLTFLHCCVCSYGFSCSGISPTKFGVCTQLEQDVPCCFAQNHCLLCIRYCPYRPYTTPPKKRFQESVLCSEIQRLFAVSTRILCNSLKHRHIGTDTLKSVPCSDRVTASIELPTGF